MDAEIMHVGDDVGDAEEDDPWQGPVASRGYTL